MNKQEYHFCPGCGSYYDDWDTIGGVCPYCGFDRNIEKLPADEVAIPDKCEEHPKYEGIGVPKTDCLTCWLMHKGYTDKKVKELQDGMK